MSDRALEDIGRILEGGGEPDDVLRAAVAVLVEEPGIAWAAIAFLEDRELVVGPRAGEPDEARRARVPVLYQGARVGELWIDGDAEPAFLTTWQPCSPRTCSSAGTRAGNTGSPSRSPDQGSAVCRAPAPPGGRARAAPFPSPRYLICSHANEGRNPSNEVPRRGNGINPVRDGRRERWRENRPLPGRSRTSHARGPECSRGPWPAKLIQAGTAERRAPEVALDEVHDRTSSSSSMSSARSSLRRPSSTASSSLSVAAATIASTSPPTASPRPPRSRRALHRPEAGRGSSFLLRPR